TTKSRAERLEQEATVSFSSAPTKKGRVLMLLSNCFDPDPRVYAEARTLVEAGYEVCVLSWDRESKGREHEVTDGIEVQRFYVSSSHGRGVGQALVMPVVWLAVLRLGLKRKFDVV